MPGVQTAPTDRKIKVSFSLQFISGLLLPPGWTRLLSQLLHGTVHALPSWLSLIFARVSSLRLSLLPHKPHPSTLPRKIILCRGKKISLPLRLQSQRCRRGSLKAAGKDSRGSFRLCHPRWKPDISYSSWKTELPKTAHVLCRPTRLLGPRASGRTSWERGRDAIWAPYPSWELLWGAVGGYFSPFCSAPC